MIVAFPLPFLFIVFCAADQYQTLLIDKIIGVFFFFR